MLQTLFGFHGRMRRSAYWAIGLVLSLGLTTTLAILGWLAFPSGAPEAGNLTQWQWAYIGLVGVTTFLGAWIRLAIQVKRWHDRNASGWWTLAVLFPILGAIWVLVECGFFDGTPGPNKYGPSPKGIGHEADPGGG
jgi:uncharacterized membrane protein YhaH (DUF805 family)